MKKLYTLFICGILILWLSGCNTNVPNPLTGSTEDEKRQVFEFNVSVVDTSAYCSNGHNWFSTSFISEDESIGLVIHDSKLYWSIVDDMSTEGKDFYEAKVVTIGDWVSYFELDGNVYIDYSDNSVFLSLSQWYDISEYR